MYIYGSHHNTLTHTRREYNDWTMVKLQHMNDLVILREELILRSENFVESFPLENSLSVDADTLLKEADQLVANQDQLHQIEAEFVLVEEQLLERQIQQETAAGFSGLLYVEYRGPASVTRVCSGGWVGEGIQGHGRGP